MEERCERERNEREWKAGRSAGAGADRGPLCATRVRHHPLLHSDLRSPPFSGEAARYAQNPDARTADPPCATSQAPPQIRRGARERMYAPSGFATTILHSPPPLRTLRERVLTALCHLRHHHTTSGRPGASRARCVQHERGVTEPRSFAHPASTVPGSGQCLVVPGGGRANPLDAGRLHYAVQHVSLARRAQCRRPRAHPTRVPVADARAARREVPRHR
ncbi:hypothetical protein B0H11DRAFT_2385737 [Mycena galericulata]|nr:hypothetical protein B0H11DRAFT_2385737 [Mycena galericulata]